MRKISKRARFRAASVAVLGGAVALMLAGCAPSSLANRTVRAEVESVEGTTVSAMLVEVPAGAPEGEATTNEQPVPPSEESQGQGRDGEGQGNSQGQKAEQDRPETPGATTDSEGQAPESMGEPPAKPGGDSADSDDIGEPPAKPEGSGSEAGGSDEPPAKPDGAAPTGEVPAGEAITFEVDAQTASTLKAGDMVEVTFGPTGEVRALETVENPGSQGPAGEGGFGGQGGPGGASEPNFGSAAATIDEDAAVSRTSYSSSSRDESALLVTDGAVATLDGITVAKTGDSTNTGDSNFYGLDAGILVNEGASAAISGASVTTDAEGANGIFCYGEGSVATISDTRIRTSGDSSGGFETAGGATTRAANLDVETQGASSAAIRSDRGGGTVEVVGGTYVTHGTGSPAIYSTADISVERATLTATGSEAVVVEGDNSVELTDCEVGGTMTGTYGADSDENIHGVMIYQSMSGDAEVGEAEFSATGGSLAKGSGDLFYVTNTRCAIELEDVALGLADGNLLTVSGNSGKRGWGEAGSNGATCELVATNQRLEGAIVVDDISSLILELEEGTVFEGTVNASGDAGKVAVELDGGQWVLTGDAHISSLVGDVANVVANGHHLYVGGERLL